ncbi:MAG: hypothetical protein M1834_001417 [Cirrosporium novae-zelandiae]|nr:MAG: hypothetical protein M1834_001417 [Cirrosporium novae-zelandiae]
MAPFRLRIDGRTFRDSQNREVTLQGINVAGDAKFPRKPDIPSYEPDSFFDGDNVSFVGRPFAIEEADLHFARLKNWGYNTIRYIFTWEAIEHSGPGIYDEEWIDHTIAILRLANNYGFYIFMDPHQDVWSRFTGGSGAPMWTLYAAGLDVYQFNVTEAALAQNLYSDPSQFPKMIWATNYTRLACQVLFTLFFGGKDFAPKAIIDGKNIQDYLQDHFIAACKHLAERIHEAQDLENEVVIGWESMNEPNHGLIGLQDLTKIPSEQKLQKGHSPTAWQAILTGSGRACEIDTWEFGNLGSYKAGRELVDPQGVLAWLSSDWSDSKYGWTRDPGWKLGECIWAQCGIWDPETDQLLKPNYFAKDPKTGETIDYEYFTNTYFLNYWRKYKAAIRSVDPNAMMFCQSPPYEIPPSLQGTEDDDPNMVYSPHFYDGITLMTKKWNRLWNVDVFGILRGRYLTPAFAIKIGETAIRNCIRDQLGAMRKEGLDYLGNHPCVFTEIGIPYDMDDKHAYKTGDYSSQIAAMDANHYGLEGCGTNGFTVWVYVATNNHEWGDRWNGEDLSIFSVDDPLLPSSPGDHHLFDVNQLGYSKTNSAGVAAVSPSNLKKALSTPSISSETSPSTAVLGDSPGYRAAEAYVRPSPIVTAGRLVSYGFDLKNCVFSLSLDANGSTGIDGPTEIFLPEFHFPVTNSTVEVSGGKWNISVDDGEYGSIQKLRWWHAEGEQDIKVTGVPHPQAKALGREDNEGYLAQCQQTTCTVM